MADHIEKEQAQHLPKPAKRLPIYKPSSHPKLLHLRLPGRGPRTSLRMPEHGLAQAGRSPAPEEKSMAVSDRWELMERIKRGESPTWSPPPAVQLQEEHQLADPAAIERPKSALHRGDFTQGQNHVRPPSRESNPLSWSPLTLQRSRSPEIPVYQPLAFPTTRPGPLPIISNLAQDVRPRLSLSSSYVPRTPTSPLYCSSVPSDYDGSPSVDIPNPQVPGLRRSATSFHSAYYPPAFSPVHQARHSVQYASSIKVPNLRQRALSNPLCDQLPRARRPSLSTNASSLVGSYEESILHGRMSSQASLPLDFIAKIGVLGRGDVRSTLRCPRQMEVSFQAVFFKYPKIGGVERPDSEPSPYVGEIHLDGPDPANPSASRRSLPGLESVPLSEPGNRQIASERRRARAPLGGSYELPSEGQIQLIVKSPSKSAVKLFLIPYNLRDMPPGTKTFLRYKAFSRGLLIEKPISSSPQASPPSKVPEKPPVLRYLLHLHLCSPSKNRYFLYKPIKIVFANRVPEGKEGLEEDIMYPEPRYSEYRPGRKLSSGLHPTPATLDEINRCHTQSDAVPIHRLDAADGIGNFSVTSPEARMSRGVAGDLHQKHPHVCTIEERRDQLGYGYDRSVEGTHANWLELTDTNLERRPLSPMRNDITASAILSDTFLDLSPCAKGHTNRAVGRQEASSSSCWQFQRRPEESKGRPFTPPGMRQGESLLTRRFREASNGL